MNIEANWSKWAIEIGKRLRARRKAEGLSLNELSRLSGSTASTLSHIERGKRDVKLSTLVTLAEALRTDLPHLLGAQDTASEVSKPSRIDGYDLDDD